MEFELSPTKKQLACFLGGGSPRLIRSLRGNIYSYLVPHAIVCLLQGYPRTISRSFKSLAADPTTPLETGYEDCSYLLLLSAMNTMEGRTVLAQPSLISPLLSGFGLLQYIIPNVYRAFLSVRGGSK